MKTSALFTIIVLTVLLTPSRADAQVNTRPVYDGIEIDEKLGGQLPLDVRMANSEGDSVTIRELIEDGKPVLLNPLYYECPMLCGLVVEGVFKAIDEVEWKPGKDYTVISFSIDPLETHEVAARHKQKYLSQLEASKAEGGWYFLTGPQSSISTLAEAVGFNYKEIEDTGEYAHTASVMFVSPLGVVTRYLYGIQFNEFDVRSALYEAADGKIGDTVTKVLMYCYQYDPDSGSYVPVAQNIMKVGGILTLLFLGLLLIPFWIREKRKKLTSNIDLQ